MAGAVTQKGQVTIPKRVRDAMGVRPGDRVEIVSDEAGGARIIKVGAAAPKVSGFARFQGIGKIPGGRSVDEYMELIRDPIDA